MTPDRITELLQPFLQAPPTLAEDILTYINILIRWNTRINLTAIRNEEEIVTRHFGESLFAASHLFPTPYPVFSPVAGACPERSRRVVKGFDSEVEDGETGTAADNASDPAAKRRQNTAHGASRGWPAENDPAPEGRKNQPPSPDSANDQRPTTNDRLADLGSGPGFPGLPIKLWAPDLALTLIESNHKKAAFLREITRSLTLMNVNIQNTRAETLLETTPPAFFDVVTLRAVERFESALPTAAALVAPAGRLALLIGTSQQDQAQASLPTFTWLPPEPIPQSTNRILLIATRPSKK